MAPPGHVPFAPSPKKIQGPPNLPRSLPPVVPSFLLHTRINFLLIKRAKPHKNHVGVESSNF